MKKFLILISVIIVAFQFIGHSQTALEVVWEKNIAPTSIDFAKFSPDGQYIYCNSGTDIYKMSTSTGEFLSRFEKSNITAIYDMRLSPKGNYITTQNGAGTLTIWDVKAEKVIKNIIVPNMGTNQGLGNASFYPNEDFILIELGTHGALYSEMLKYDWKNDTVVSRCIPSGATSNHALSHDGKTFVTGCTYKDNSGNFHNKLSLWDAETFKEIRILEDNQEAIEGYGKIVYSMDDKYIGRQYRTAGKIVRIFDIKNSLILSTSRQYAIDYMFLPDNSGYLLDYYYTNTSSTAANYYSMSNELLDSILIDASNYEVTRLLGDKYYVLAFTKQNFILMKNNPTRVNEEQASNTVRCIYLSNTLTIISDEEKEKASVQISNTSGNVIFEDVFSPLLLKTNIKLNLAVGVYFCKLTIGDSTHAVKFIVER